MIGGSAGATEGLTLAVTSSTGVIGLAVGRVASGRVADDRISEYTVEHLSEIEVVTDRRHAEEISPRTSELLASAGVGLGDLDRLVVDFGPGRFTGLRVGLATVRALAFALNLPVVGVSSLEVLAAGAVSDTAVAGDGAPPAVVTAVIDARRGEVFQQTFRNGQPVAPAQVGEPDQLAATVEGGSVVVGDGVDRYLDQYRAAEANRLRLFEGRVPKASVMLELSQGRPGVPGTEIQPLYLREPDAKPNIKTRVGS